MPGTGKMKHVSLTLQVENDLKHQLSIGALKPGARLITKNLAEQLGGNDSNLLIVFYVQIMPDDFVMQLHR
ncbi:hypothetical protein P2R60_20325, partial [Escherichia coli]